MGGDCNGGSASSGKRRPWRQRAILYRRLLCLQAQVAVAKTKRDIDMSEQFYAARLAEAQEEIVRLKERLRPHDPETELPPDNQVVLVLGRLEGFDDMTRPRFHLASRYLGEWVTTSDWAIFPVVWWPLPEQQKGDQ